MANKSKSHKVLLGLSLLTVVVLVLILSFLRKPSNMVRVVDTRKHQLISEKVIISGNEVFVEIADTPEKMARGLSGRNSIAPDRGMLFILSPNSYPTFWMKDMLMPIDIIWINDGEIVQINRNIAPPAAGTPDSALEQIRPKVPVDYVLEVGANVSIHLGFEVGDVVDLTQVGIN